MRLAVPTLLAVLALAAPAEARVDRSFWSGTGWRALGAGVSDAGAHEVLVTRRGKILVAGYAFEPRTYDTVIALARLHPSGRLDRRFGRRGRALVDVGPSFPVAALQELPDGKLLLAFTALEDPHGQVGVVRLHASGRVDRGYGRRGIAWVQVPGVGASVAGMTVVRGGAVVLAGTALTAQDDPRVLIARVDARGRAGRVELRDLDGARAVGVTRTRLGHVMIAAYRERTATSLLFGLGPFAAPKALQGVHVREIAADRRAGVALLLTAGRRWGVRRYAETFAPRTAPAALQSRGEPSGLAVGPGSVSWVGLPGGRVARVGRTGRELRRSRFLGAPFLIDVTALARAPRDRVVAVGHAYNEDLGDIREDYGVARMWVGRFRR